MRLIKKTSLGREELETRSLLNIFSDLFRKGQLNIASSIPKILYYMNLLFLYYKSNINLMISIC